jgi:hypothetical protein
MRLFGKTSGMEIARSYFTVVRYGYFRTDRVHKTRGLSVSIVADTAAVDGQGETT